VSRPPAAILLTGNELLRGVIADRNASWLAARLEEARGIASASAWIARAIERDLDRETAAPAGERCPTCGRIG